MSFAPQGTAGASREWWGVLHRFKGAQSPLAPIRFSTPPKGIRLLSETVGHTQRSAAVEFFFNCTSSPFHLMHLRCKGALCMCCMWNGEVVVLRKEKRIKPKV